jgi:radical SAM superfamily enzyme YgiQ (UPF0313 family)
MRILLITPPMVQVNSPYAATPALAGFLKTHGHEVAQVDASLELALRLFSRAGADALRARLKQRFARRRAPAPVAHFLAHAGRYGDTADPVIRFLQGRDPALALRIAGRQFLPEGLRFAGLAADAEGADPLTRAFGELGTHDLAVHLASLYLDDWVDAIHTGVDDQFDLSRYGERLAASAPVFDGLERALRRRPTLVDALIDELAETALRRHAPDVVGLTLPFPGTVYGGFRIARRIKALSPRTPVILGGGYVSTELRALREPRVFDYADYVVLDDGETPLLQLLATLEGKGGALRRTWTRRGRRVVWHDSEAPDLPHAAAAAPDFTGLPLDRYFAMAEMLNPMHRVWSCTRWNKLMLAHGCYWHRCRFCDTDLDYVRRYSAAPATVLADRIEEVIAQTGQTGFHFIDEALPPGVLRRLADELLRRRLAITWWGNIRFDAAFTPELAQQLAAAGCVAVTGGLEAAQDRLLALLDKGFTVAQATRVMRAFADAGILVHAYLMYGCPTQTEAETLEALEVVRGLFAEGCLQSAYWHRFALTAHSEFHRRAREFGLRIPRQGPAPFARNEVPFRDPVATDPARLGRGLRKAVYNYMHGVGLEDEVTVWFDPPAPAPRKKTPNGRGHDV